MSTALIPLKDLVEAKSRLAGLLRPSERRALAQAMAEDVLAALARHPAVERCILLSDDPGAGLLAGRYRVESWSERALGARGLNAVLRAACARLRGGEAGGPGPGPVLVLHADLPLLGAADIDAVHAALQTGDGLVIGPDRHRRGTNLLAFGAGRVPAFHFGTQSFARHTAAAGAAGMSVGVVATPGIALDVDEPGDLALLLERGAGRDSRALALLREPGLAGRIELSLASLGTAAFAAGPGGAEQGGGQR